MVYQLTVPIIDYSGEGIHFQEMYIQSDRVPTPEQWRNLAWKYHLRDSEHPEYQHIKDWLETYKTIRKLINEGYFPMIGGNLVSSNGYVQTKLGPHPVTVTRLEVEVI